MRAELISIGTELLLGEIVDTNAAFLARELAACGINLYYQSTVGDNFERARQVLAMALKRSDLVLINGGLGPTDDDLTREIAACAAGRELVEDPRVWRDLQSWFGRRYGGAFQIPAHNRKQALFPEGSKVLDNPLGTAPGFFLELEQSAIIALPGVPGELEVMFREKVRPILQGRGSGQLLVTKNLNFVGIGESALEDKISLILAKQSNPTLALYASGGKLRLRLTARAQDQKSGLVLIKPVEELVKELTSDYFYGEDEDTLESVIAFQLKAKGLTLAAAESCTGGLISHTLTNVPGSSSYFERSYVVYSNRSKTEDLGVPVQILQEHGAVSAQTAEAMARGVRLKAGTDLGLAVTGIAGPGGGTEQKPVGLVYIALAASGDTIVERHLWQGSREQIKNRAALAALRLLWLKSRA